MFYVILFLTPFIAVFLAAIWLGASIILEIFLFLIPFIKVAVIVFLILIAIVILKAFTENF